MIKKKSPYNVSLFCYLLDMKTLDFNKYVISQKIILKTTSEGTYYVYIHNNCIGTIQKKKKCSSGVFLALFL